MTVTDELLAELEEAASNATQDAWELLPGTNLSGPEIIANGEPIAWVLNSEDDAVHIATANPATITALTAELRRLRAENAELAKDTGRLEWMVTEGAVIARMNGTGRPMCYQVSFPFESCQQLEWFPSWREAVDAMMAAQ